MSMKQSIMLLVTALGLVMVAGCGSSDSTSTSTTATYSGIVSGSLYENATVCLDSDDDQTCNGEAVSTKSDANGAFTLTGGAYTIVAELSGATKHAVAGDTGTAADAIVLVSPNGATDTDGVYIVSAISTNVWRQMDANSQTLAQAKTAVANALGVDESSLLENFNGTTMSATTRNKLSSEAEALEQMLADNSGSFSALASYVSTFELPSRVDAIQ